jgi:LPS-assembly lipoprotein
LQRLRFMPLLAALAMLAACGFQLQGRQMLPASLGTVRVDAIDSQSDFTHALRASLKLSGAQLDDAGGANAAVVRILRDEVEERVVSVDARNIPTDYELIYQVEIEVRAQGKELMAMEPFTLSRIFSFDERKVLAKEREKDMLREALARDMASVVTRRLSAL